MIRRITITLYDLGELLADTAEAEVEDTLLQPPPGVPPVTDLIIHSATVQEPDIVADITIDLHSLVHQSVALGDDLYDILTDLKSTLPREDLAELVAWIKKNQAELKVAYIITKDGEIEILHTKADSL